MNELIADNSEHVPLLVTTHCKQNASSLMKSNKVTNGNGLIDIIEHQQSQPIVNRQQSSALMSNNTAAHVMRSRLNQYKTSTVIVNFDENGTADTMIIGREKDSKNKKNKKKNSVADI